jgi:hypothetical protein
MAETLTDIESVSYTDEIKSELSTNIKLNESVDGMLVRSDLWKQIPDDRQYTYKVKR